ncbi:hypothetical protein HPB47_012512 [Ixodes persulcatus]|uniref:Uncharacterized protein n=1 Tax=Ixodes persulcatus TaxID=34615 RepID=A0AC60NTE0_IXOPE|nr:hypothetical protein HPB47_012512 [Ixodes persulcatus]
MLTSVPRNVHDILAISPSRNEHYSLNDKPYVTLSYIANDPFNARGVIHGIAAEESDDVINANLKIHEPKLLGARRIGRTNSILITVEGNQLPRYAFFSCGAFRVYHQYPRSKQCTHCHVIGHRADVCPGKTEYTRYPNFSRCFPRDQDPVSTPHYCEPFCFNCEGEHPPSSLTCPVRADAHKAARAWTKAQKRHRARVTGPPPKHDCKEWPALPTNNRNAMLQPQRSRQPIEPNTPTSNH